MLFKNKSNFKWFKVYITIYFYIQIHFYVNTFLFNLFIWTKSQNQSQQNEPHLILYRQFTTTICWELQMTECTIPTPIRFGYFISNLYGQSIWQSESKRDKNQLKSPSMWEMNRVPVETYHSQKLQTIS